VSTLGESNSVAWDRFRWQPPLALRVHAHRDGV